ncbi:uncharacterized protein TNCV_1664231 [Trichonephila clavipes]|uniref:Uncharacterized protein n=1 Tax=Trichonephila clavipes TaxID=2585209 RepID=A0A8X6VAH4_TRICX|nr:uncharacterized protein TNCV_1664231 [Trichonephila clavipes]
MGAQRVINPDNIVDGSFELKRDNGVANPEGLICENICEEKYTIGTLMGCEKQITVNRESFRNHTMAKIAGQSNRTLPVVSLGRLNRYPYPRIKCMKYRNLNQGFVKGILETGGVMDKCVQMWTRNYGALGQMARVCFGVLCANRTREVKRDFGDLPIRRSKGRVVNTLLVFKRVLFGGKKKRKSRKKGQESLRERTDGRRRRDEKRERGGKRKRERKKDQKKKGQESPGERTDGRRRRDGKRRKESREERE